MAQSFISYKRLVGVGDTLFVYLSPTNIYPIRVTTGSTFQTKYGALRHDQIIGKPYGCALQCAKGFVHLLHSTPELWTLSLPHRTQILYTTDISFICTQLDLRPGSVVCEAGTGSGSLSHAIARTIAPNGRLVTYDFHEERAATARQEFADHGLSDIITAEHRDVCCDGFAYTEYFDALFLDLPHPWLTISSANRALKPNGGRICCFSPCVEQVQKTCAALNDHHFLDIDTYECVLRPYDLKTQSMPSYQFSSTKSYSEENSEANEAMDEKSDESLAKKLRTEEDSSEKNDNSSDVKSNEYVLTYSPNQSTGHTGFLTVAVKYQ
ncbi:unnamed protein product [Oppiella nova]|uniref:tRNA (adenine(58)-N(1))-methyltransferase catalytic subunit TRMT61A n=1 Tax=Oppiella nova TaxID=334625 RepID=A0A7R9LGX2_9ACAR|nr:unnamed protein product [Oppiella nova]CAG2162839.1 unnamed protein product [Oppiella nova]